MDQAGLFRIGQVSNERRQRAAGAARDATLKALLASASRGNSSAGSAVGSPERD
jgi:hypothetical protein